jgi:hypothetical protein
MLAEPILRRINAVLHRQVGGSQVMAGQLALEAHDLVVQPDQPILGGPPFRLVRVLLQCPRDVDAAPGVLALAHVRGGIVTAVRALGEVGRPPVEVELRRVALTAPCEIVGTRSPSACISVETKRPVQEPADCPPAAAFRSATTASAWPIASVIHAGSDGFADFQLSS